MIDSTKSSPPVDELAALGRAASPAALMEVTVSGSPREADGPAARLLLGRAAGPGAAQTRQIVPWTHESVESIIYRRVASARATRRTRTRWPRPQQVKPTS